MVSMTESRGGVGIQWPRRHRLTLLHLLLGGPPSSPGLPMLHCVTAAQSAAVPPRSFMPPGPPVAVPIPDPTAQPAVPSRRRRTRYTTVEYAVANDAAEFHEHPVPSFSNVPICPNVVYVIVHAQRRRRRASSLQMPLVGRDGGRGLRRTGTSLARWATRATYLCNTEFIAMLATFKLYWRL